MIIKMLKSERDYLLENVLVNNVTLTEIIKKAHFANGKFEIEIEIELADEIRDLCSERLQIEGFDKDYELTEDGKVLEMLIDTFYNGT